MMEELITIAKYLILIPLHCGGALPKCKLCTEEFWMRGIKQIH